MLHKITVCPVPNQQQINPKKWQGWCYNVGCDWYAEGKYDTVWAAAAKHRGVSDI